jgi:hypothetical protein
MDHCIFLGAGLDLIAAEPEVNALKVLELRTRGLSSRAISERLKSLVLGTVYRAVNSRPVSSRRAHQ